MSRECCPPRGIPDAVIQSVKNNTSFLSLLSSYGIEAAKKGKSSFAICPFHRIDGHPEKTPSLSIEPSSNLYHCFSCNARGNVIQFVMDMEKVTFPEAVDKLLALKGAGIRKVEREACPACTEPGRSEPAERAIAATRAAMSEEQRQTILAEILRRSVDDLRNSDGGRRYLESRGLDPLQLLQSFTFGFWNGKTFDKLESGERKKLASIGLVNGNRALFENCIVFPLIKEGRIATMYGRKTVENGTTEGRHYLLPHRREGLYLPKQGLNAQRPAIITESIIDGLSLFAAGVTNVLPLLGVNGFLPDHLAYLKEQCFPQIFIALNGDEAGNRAAAALKQQLADNGLQSGIIELPQSKDINDMLREMGASRLKAWFEEATGQKSAVSSQQEKPTVSEDDRGVLYVLCEDREYRVQGLALVGMERLRANIKLLPSQRQEHVLRGYARPVLGQSAGALHRTGSGNAQDRNADNLPRRQRSYHGA